MAQTRDDELDSHDPVEGLGGDIRTAPIRPESTRGFSSMPDSKRRYFIEEIDGNPLFI